MLIKARFDGKNGGIVMKLFAASGGCSAPEMIIKGKVNGITFTSNEFTGTMNSQKFWDDLRAFAKSKNAFIKLMY